MERTRDERPQAPEGRHRFKIRIAGERLASSSGLPCYGLCLELKDGHYQDVWSNPAIPDQSRSERTNEFLERQLECFRHVIGWTESHPRVAECTDEFQRLNALEGLEGETLFRKNRSEGFEGQLEAVWTALPPGPEGEHGFRIAHASQQSARTNGLPYWLLALRLEETRYADVLEILPLPHKERSEKANEWLGERLAGLFRTLGRPRPEDYEHFDEHDLVGAHGSCEFHLENNPPYGERLEPDFANATERVERPPAPANWREWHEHKRSAFEHPVEAPKTRAEIVARKREIQDYYFEHEQQEAAKAALETHEGDDSIISYVNPEIEESLRSEYRKDLTDANVYYGEGFDLHDMGRDAASSKIRAIMREAHKRGLERTLIIHGKGIHSEGGRPVLKPLVRNELRKNRWVLGYHSEPKSGGDFNTGATRVRIKT